MFKLIKPADLTFATVKAWIKQSPEAFNQTLKLHAGEHWQDGLMWSGELPEEEGAPRVRDQAKKRLKKSHTSQNVVKELTERHVAGLVGLDPLTRYAPVKGSVQTTEGETAGNRTEDSEADKAALEANRGVSAWLGRQAFKHKLQQVARLINLGDVEAGLRLWIPPVKLARVAGLTDEQIEGLGSEGSEGIPLPEGLTLIEALDLIHLDVVVPGKGTVFTDVATQDRFGAYVFAAEGGEFVEASYLSNDEANKGQTVITTFTTDGRRMDSTAFDLQGNLTMLTVAREGGPLVTPQVVEQQALLNKALTGLNLNLDWAGFLERIFLNAQNPTEEVPDPERPGETKTVSKPYRVGHGTAMFLSGHEIEDAEGNLKGVTNPSVVIREPSDPAVYVKTADAARRAALHETNQLHAEISGDAAPSGESRIQALADFIISLLMSAPAINSLGLWAIETVLLLAYALMNEAAPLQTGEETDDAEQALRATFKVRIDPGPLSPDMMRAVMDRVKAGLLSRPTAIAIMGIHDVDTELGLIEQQATLDRMQMRANVVKALTDAGLSLEHALGEAGYTPEEVAKLIGVETNPPPQ